MILKTVTALALRLVRRTDAPERPLIVAPPCQSEIKRTLRRGGRPANTMHSRGFRGPARRSFNADGERQVSSRDRLWFRNGGCAGRVHLSHGVRHQSKIYAESNQSDFSQIFGELTSMQTLAIYRRLLVRSKPAGVNRNRTKRDDRGREMFFLLRMAFWLGLVLVLLPRDKTPESDKLPQIGASEAVSAATAAVSDMGQFCKRQPAACEVGGQAATVIGQRAQDGARKLYQIITDKKPARNAGSHRLDRQRRGCGGRDRRRRAPRHADAGRPGGRMAGPPTP